MLFSRNVPTAPGGLEPSSYVRTKTSPDQWLPRLAVRTCFQDISLALPLSVSWFCLHPSPENRQQSSAGVGRSHCPLGSYSGIFPPSKETSFPQASWHEKS